MKRVFCLVHPESLLRLLGSTRRLQTARAAGLLGFCGKIATDGSAPHMLLFIAGKTVPRSKHCSPCAVRKQRKHTPNSSSRRWRLGPRLPDDNIGDISLLLSRESRIEPGDLRKKGTNIVIPFLLPYFLALASSS